MIHVIVNPQKCVSVKAKKTGDVNAGVLDVLHTLQGRDGLSAYEVAVKNGFVGTVDDWLVSLRMRYADLPDDLKQRLAEDLIQAESTVADQVKDFEAEAGIIAEGIRKTAADASQSADRAENVLDELARRIASGEFKGDCGFDKESDRN